jgi:hypothetical protein
MIESKFNTPSKFTGEMMGTKVAVEYNHSTIDFDQVVDAFNTILTGLGYHPDAIKEWIIDRAAEYNKEDAQSENNEWDVTLEDGLEDEGDYFWEENKTNQVISILTKMEVDGDTMQYILEEVGMDEQMAIQLATKFPKTVVDHIYELEMEGNIPGKTGRTVDDNTPPYVSDDFQIGPNGAYEHNDEEYIDSIVAAIKANQIKKKKKLKS